MYIMIASICISTLYVIVYTYKCVCIVCAQVLIKLSCSCEQILLLTRPYKLVGEESHKTELNCSGLFYRKALYIYMPTYINTEIYIYLFMPSCTRTILTHLLNYRQLVVGLGEYLSNEKGQQVRESRGEKGKKVTATALVRCEALLSQSQSSSS